MAPRKEKAEKVASNEAADLVLDYLRKQNRPYSATDISANLHNKVSKAAAAKLLKEMHDRKEIEGRSAGKQSVYHVIQDPEDAASPGELKAMDIEIQTIKDQIAAAQGEAKSLKAALTNLNATMSTSDLRAAVDVLEEEKAEILGRLAGLRSGSIRPITAEEKVAVDSDAKHWSKVESERAKITKDMWLQIVDCLPEGIDAAEVRENLGLDE
ncbi:homologous-pairing protein-like protein 2 [Saccharata proteae CBS 121410]|uniref:Homologous-pairing protein-like protein 2 n=1 Tax=Saccharata proteae CBS 121410 TaxID=1314787 RepID=A0A9P4LX31_9PEZI|nr:homologous-pairing protein-like protein 2 [Saccharata proteae CBS 121410]